MLSKLNFKGEDICWRHEVRKTGLGGEFSCKFAKKYNNEWIKCLTESEWNIDNLFIELEANRIEY